MAPLEIEVFDTEPVNDRKLTLEQGSSALLQTPLALISVNVDNQDERARIGIYEPTCEIAIMEVSKNLNFTKETDNLYLLDNGGTISISPPDEDRPRMILRKFI